MKKTMKTIAILALMFGTLTGHATDSYFGSDPKMKATTILHFDDVKRGHQLTIKSVNDDIVHREIIDRNGDYTKKFDLSILEDGNYYIELDKDLEIVLRPFKIQENRVIFDMENQKSIYKPILRTKNNKVLINMLSLDSQPLNVDLYYGGELIYSEELPAEKIIQRAYSLSKQRKGSYQAVLKSGNRIYTKSFTI